MVKGKGGEGENKGHCVEYKRGRRKREGGEWRRKINRRSSSRDGTTNTDSSSRVSRTRMEKAKEEERKEKKKTKERVRYTRRQKRGERGGVVKKRGRGKGLAQCCQLRCDHQSSPATKTSHSHHRCQQHQSFPCRQYINRIPVIWHTSNEIHIYKSYPLTASQSEFGCCKG